MIPIRLELQAFGPFTAEQVIDFTAIHSEKLFLITGNTGSGKTTIFDAITFALYGEPSGSVRSIDDFKSQFAGDELPCYVRFQFMIGDATYIVYREPPQLKPKRGGGLTKALQTVELTLDNGEIVAGISVVNKRLEAILGINCEQFRKLVMLPQGEFRRFLSEKTSSKQDTLRRIFKTELLDQFTKTLGEKVKLLERQNKDIDAVISSLINQIQCDEQTFKQPDRTTVIPQLEQYNISTRTVLATAKDDSVTISRKLEAINLPYHKEINRSFTTLETEKLHLQQLKAQSSEMDKLKQDIIQLKAIQELIPIKETLDKCNTEVSTYTGKLDITKAQLERIIAKREEIQPQFEQAQRNLQAVEQQVKQIEQLKQVRAIIDETAKLKVEQESVAARTAKIEQNCVWLHGALAFFKLQEEVRLLTAYDKAQEAYTIADTHYRGLFSGYLNSQAALLGAQLTDGKPCPVCGSVEHPTPCQSDDNIVSQKQLDTAKLAYERAAAQLEFARAAMGELEPSSLSQKQAQLDIDAPTYTGFNSNAAATSDKVNALTRELDLLTHRNRAISERLAAMDAVPQNETVESVNCKIATIQKSVDDTNKCYNLLYQQLHQLEDTAARAEQSVSSIKEYITRQAEQASTFLRRLSARMNELNITAVELEHSAKLVQGLTAMEQRYSKYQSECQATTALITTLTTQLDGKTPVNLADLQTEHDSLSQQLSAINTTIESISPVLSVNESICSAIKQQLRQAESVDAQYNKYHTLYSVACGERTNKISFESHVLAYYFNRVIINANLRLEQMTNKRYTIVIRQEKEKYGAQGGLELNIHDAHTGKQRDVITLSGGESFKVALALSLGLADITAEHSGGVVLSTLFIDEGFGSLDSDSIDSAIECLSSLRQQGRYIGIISHVAELRDRISARISVKQLPTGSIILQ